MLNKANEISTQVKKAISGKDEVIEKVLMVLLAGGHILLNDVPGVGKTTLALAFSRAMGLKFNRVQFTPDVVPSDITGFTMYDKGSGKFYYHPGSAMCNLMLADEINRTSSKTQSALLEVMQEGKVTVDGNTREVPKPFMVIATQNPLGTAGTQRLPEAQLDRFMIQLEMGYPDHAAQVEMLGNRSNVDPLDAIQPVASSEDIMAMKQQVNSIYTDAKIYDYVTTLTEKTRESEYFRLGLSPRAAIAICSLAKARAYLAARDFVTPDDIKAVFFDSTRHRVVAGPKAQLEGKELKDIISEILAEVTAPVTDKGN